MGQQLNASSICLEDTLLHKPPPSSTAIFIKHQDTSQCTNSLFHIWHWVAVVVKRTSMVMMMVMRVMVMDRFAWLSDGSWPLVGWSVVLGNYGILWQLLLVLYMYAVLFLFFFCFLSCWRGRETMLRSYY